MLFNNAVSTSKVIQCRMEHKEDQEW